MSSDSLASKEAGAPDEIELEVTPEMIEAAMGIGVSTDDSEAQKAAAYSAIFAVMLIASKSPLLVGVSKVVSKTSRSWFGIDNYRAENCEIEPDA